MRRRVRLTIILALLLCAVVASAQDTQHPSDARFSMLEESDLRQIWFEKTKGRVSIQPLQSRESLIQAIKKEEAREEETKSLKARIERALEKIPARETYRIKFLFCSG